jgi:hypothetical protein
VIGLLLYNLAPARTREGRAAAGKRKEERGVRRQPAEKRGKRRGWRQLGKEAGKR